MGSIINLDLLWVGLAVAGAGTLGFSIYFSDTKSATSRAFLFFALASICWSVVNFASARATEPTLVLWLIRLVLFFAIWHAFSFFVLARQFPSRDSVFRKQTFFGLLSWTAAISIFVLTPTVYEQVLSVAPIVETKTGPGIALFAITVFGFIGTGVWVLLCKFLRSIGPERRQMEVMFAGMVTTFVFLVTFDFLFPAFLNIPTLVPYGGLFLLPLILGTAYAILHEHLFNIKVIATATLVFILSAVSFGGIIFSDSFLLVIFHTGVLVLVLIFGINLIRGVLREVEQREKIEKLAEELQQTNERQEGLIHFIGHEVKGFLTKAAGAFAALSDGDFGELSPTLRPFVDHALLETRQGADSVASILKASNLKKGTVTYAKESFDLKPLVAETVEKAKGAAEEKGLALSFVADDASYTIVGDRGEIGDHVLRNLIDNAVNYTPSGSITVSLKRTGEKIVFAVEDTGVGITDEDKKRLFTEGGHGKDSQRVNVHSTGYGLFIAKSIVTAHGGTIRAESAGAGKGSTFIVEFPAN
ncbi:MAG: sensor histidine kinase [Minisyncoccota bacterium]